jgi:hypothetical protein
VIHVRVEARTKPDASSIVSGSPTTAGRRMCPYLMVACADRVRVP